MYARVDLSHETDLKLSSARLNVNLCDDGVSFLILESKLEEVLDCPLTILSLAAPSLPRTLRDNIALTLTFSDPTFPLAQSPKFKVGETFGVDASVDEDDICCESDTVLIEEHNLDETLIERSCVDVVVTISPNPDHVDHVSLFPLVFSMLFLSCSLLSLSLECCNLAPIDSHIMLEGYGADCFKSLGIFRGYDSSLDHYSLHLQDMLGNSC